MPKNFNVTLDNNYVIVADQKGIVFAGNIDNTPDWLKEAVKHIYCD